MTSNLYYSNLGIEDEQINNFRNQVHLSLREFNDYLDRALERLRQRDYSYDIRIAKIELYLQGEVSIPSNQSYKKAFFLDRNGEIPVEALNFDAKRKCLTVKAIPSGTDHIYLKVEGETKAVGIQARVFVSSIIPLIEEEREDEALDFLCYQADRLSEDCSGRSFRIMRPDRDKGTLELDGVPAGAKVRAQADSNVVRQQLLAIQTLATRPKEHHIPLLRLLLRSRNVKWKKFVPSSPQQYYVLTDEHIDGCQEQRNFVDIALATPDFAILDGPPGSGKTTTILELIIQLVRNGKRVMVVASTHVAVDNILERLSEEGPGGTLLDRFGIVPLRIGKESVVSERIGQYCLDNVLETQREKMRDRLAAMTHRSPAQEKWYNALCQEGDQSELLSSMYLDMANLVCGTTIGILRAPSITAASDGTPPFDYLILDEASKTTFQEFLVPALHARRWILSGDPRQLAPYVEESNVVDNLRSIGGRFDLTDDVRMACLETLEAVAKSNTSWRGNPPLTTLLVLEDDSPALELIRDQIAGVRALLDVSGGERFRSLAAVVVTKEPEDVLDRARLASSPLVVTTRSLQPRILPYIPPRHKVVVWGKKEKQNDHRSRERNNWEEEIAWRLGRMYEVQDQDESYDKYSSEVKILLPYCLDDAGEVDEGERKRAWSPSERFQEGIDSIRRIALPSVLNLMMEGFETRGEKTDLKVALFDGLPEHVLDQRRILLTYQHRMHPEISAFPRAQFYDHKALRDSTGMEAKRSWSYGGFSHRCVVQNVRPELNDVSSEKANFNQAEVDLLAKYLKNLLMWTETHPKEDGKPWTVALLTFYKGQEKLLIDMVRSDLGVTGKRYFDLTDRNVDLQVCVVDRFQGHEADVVFLSFVRSWRHRKRIGFLDNSNRLNVALTRAKFQLVVLADTSFFLKKGTPALKNFMGAFQGDINYRRQ